MSDNFIQHISGATIISLGQPARGYCLLIHDILFCFPEKPVMYSGSWADEVEACGHQIDFLSELRRAMNH